MLSTIDNTLHEFLEQSQRSVLHRAVAAVETLVLFAIAKINAGLLPSSAHFDSSSNHSYRSVDLPTDVGATGASAVLVAYTRREEQGISARLTRRIRRMMHHSVDLRPFQATVRLIDINQDFDDEEDEDNIEVDDTTPNTSPIRHRKLSAAARTPSSSSSLSSSSRRRRKKHASSPRLVMYTPMSFPPSPGARRALLSDFSSATQNLLKKASSILQEEADERKKRQRQQSTVKSLGSLDVTPSSCALVQFGDHSEDIQLTCGNHGVTTSLSSTIATVRSSIPLQQRADANVYYEYHLSHLSSAVSTGVTLGVGLATSSMRLFECASGTTTCSTTGERAQQPHQERCCGALFTKSASLKIGDTVGILCKVRRSPNQEVCTTTLQFAVNGRPLDAFTKSITVKTNEQLWPSLTLYSNVFVLGLFSPSDLRYPPNDNNIVGLDGSTMHHI
jgi:hypothetical protein